MPIQMPIFGRFIKARTVPASAAKSKFAQWSNAKLWRLAQAAMAGRAFPEEDGTAAGVAKIKGEVMKEVDRRRLDFSLRSRKLTNKELTALYAASRGGRLPSKSIDRESVQMFAPAIDAEMRRRGLLGKSGGGPTGAKPIGTDGRSAIQKLSDRQLWVAYTAAKDGKPYDGESGEAMRGALPKLANEVEGRQQSWLAGQAQKLADDVMKALLAAARAGTGYGDSFPEEIALIAPAIEIEAQRRGISAAESSAAVNNAMRAAMQPPMLAGFGVLADGLDPSKDLAESKPTTSDAAVPGKSADAIAAVVNDAGTKAVAPPVTKEAAKDAKASDGSRMNTGLLVVGLVALGWWWSTRD